MESGQILIEINFEKIDVKLSSLVQISQLFFDNKRNWNQLSEIQTSSDFGIPL